LLRMAPSAPAAPSVALRRLPLARQFEKIVSRHVVEGARLDDAECLALLREEAEYLGVGFTGLIHLFSPQRLIMGGGVAKAFDLMNDDIHAVIRRNAMAPFKDVPVVVAALGDDCGLVGAAALALAAVEPADR
jgi:glucokinase